MQSDGNEIDIQQKFSIPKGGQYDVPKLDRILVSSQITLRVKRML